MTDDIRKTSIKEITTIIQKSKDAFSKGVTKSYESRVKNLNKLKSFLIDNKQKFYSALEKDLLLNELGCYNEVDEGCRIVDEALSNLSSWMAVENVSTPLLQQPGSCHIMKEPYGTVLIIAPWNYPVSLLCKPLVGAIAAGCSVIIKPSEVSQNVACVFGENFKKTFSGDEWGIIEGGAAETTELLKHRFDKILFTGSTAVGKIVAKAAAEHLTAVSLELGGKSPCYIDENVNISAAANRIMWGKFLNCGQTCVAPDYVLVHKSRKDEFLDYAKKSLKTFYGEDPQKSKDYGRIISTRHYDRIEKLLEGQNVVVSTGKSDRNDRYIAPTIVLNPKLDSVIMQEEIFGPILPVLEVDSVDAAIRFILDTKEKPLASYVFSSSSTVQDKYLEAISSGGACVNECVMHVLCDELPFGGVGNSGSGAYNGKHTFDEFTHKKSVLKKATWSDPSIRYPPYSPFKMTAIKTLQTLKLGKFLYLIGIPIVLFAIWKIVGIYRPK
jgi:acyl-CoA reductase-like NAD-dependent aldehyde dehydrogenase